MLLDLSPCTPPATVPETGTVPALLAAALAAMAIVAWRRRRIPGLSALLISGGALAMTVLVSAAAATCGTAGGVQAAATAGAPVPIAGAGLLAGAVLVAAGVVLAVVARLRRARS